MLTRVECLVLTNSGLIESCVATGPNLGFYPQIDDMAVRLQQKYRKGDFERVVRAMFTDNVADRTSRWTIDQNGLDQLTEQVDKRIRRTNKGN